MTKDVIELAREAGFFLYDLTETHGIKTVESDAADQWAQLAHFAALVAARERERVDVLRAALKPFAAYEQVRSTMGGCTPKEGLLWAVEARAGRAEISVEDMQAAIRALNTEGEGHDRP